MKTAALRLAVAAALFLAATHAFPQDGGLYVSAGTMATFAGPHDFEIGDKPADTDFTANRKGTGTFDVGILGFHAAVGYSIFGFRPEVEIISYRQLKLSDFEYTSFTTQDGVELPGAVLDALNESIVVESGSLKMLGMMANVWYDIDTGSAFIPYLGGGVGVGQITLDTRSHAKLGGVSRRQVFPASSASAFAFQAGAGVGYDVGAGVAISLGYRLSGTTEAVLAWNAKDTAKDEVLKASILLHNVDLGISYRF